MSKKVEITLQEQNELVRTLNEEHMISYMSARRGLNEYEIQYENIRLVYLISQRLRDSSTLDEASYWNAVLQLVLCQSMLKSDNLRNRIEMTLNTLLKE